MAEKLSEKQARFCQAVARLILKADELGYAVTFGDCYRDPRCPYGHPNSNHRKRLAVDLNLFRGGRYLTRTEDYAELGEYWKTLAPDAVWGGDFDDGNHFSFEHEGQK